MGRGSRDYAFWTIAIALVLIFALIPVIWLISLSLKPAGGLPNAHLSRRSASSRRMQPLLIHRFSSANMCFSGSGTSWR